MTAAWLAWGAAALLFAAEAGFQVWRRRRALRVWEATCAERERQQEAHARAVDALLAEVVATFEREHSR